VSITGLPVAGHLANSAATIDEASVQEFVSGLLVSLAIVLHPLTRLIVVIPT
jgi:hypothetical protein